MKSPPLVEAVCDLRFTPDSPWDWTIPGRLFERIRDEFPERQEIEAFGVEAKLSSKETPVRVQKGPHRLQMKRLDGSALIQVGPRLLAMNQLVPYEGWPKFRALIEKVYQEYAEVAESTLLARLSLRFINRISWPVGEVACGDWITLDPPLSGPLDRPLAAFYQRYEIMHEEIPALLLHQTGVMTAEDGKPMLTLDLDFASQEASDLDSLEAVLNWLERAHDKIEEAFKASLNPEFYKRLSEGGTQ